MSAVDEHNLFWKEVREAHDKVVINHDLIVEIARNGKRAVVYWSEASYEHYQVSEACVIVEVAEAITATKEPLPVPVYSHHGRRKERGVEPGRE